MPQLRHAELQYDWHKLGFFSHWVGGPGTNVVFFSFGLPDQIKEALIHSLTASTDVELQLDNPFAVLPVIVQEVITAFDAALWQCRDLVRSFEKV